MLDKHEQALAERIRAVRKHLDMNQIDFAKLIAISSGYISEIEQGKKRPGAYVLLNIKRAIKEIDGNWLLSGKGEMLLAPVKGKDRKTLKKK